MPYIKQERRGDIIPTTPGELNYLFTRLINQYLMGGPVGINYTRINDVVGALECAKLELYRRVVAPYEDDKINENGDVYAATLVL